MLSQAQVQLQDSGKNVKVTVSGLIDSARDDSELVILDLDKLDGNPRGIRLDSIIWVVEEKATLYLCWGDQVIMPVESRNTLRFDTPLNSPKEVRQIKLRCRKPMDYNCSFFLILDMDKQ